MDHVANGSNRGRMKMARIALLQEEEKESLWALEWLWLVLMEFFSSGHQGKGTGVVFSKEKNLDLAAYQGSTPAQKTDRPGDLQRAPGPKLASWYVPCRCYFKHKSWATWILSLKKRQMENFSFTCPSPRHSKHYMWRITLGDSHHKQRTVLKSWWGHSIV